MIKEKVRFLRNGLRVFDLLLIFPSFYAAYHLYIHVISPLLPSVFTGLYPIQAYTWILYFTVPLCPVIFHLSGLYVPFRIEPKRRTLSKIIRAMAILILVEYFSVLIVFKAFYVSRLFIFLFGLIYAALLVGLRILLLLFLYRIREKGFNLHQVLVIGTGTTALKVYEEIETYRFLGLKLLGFIACGTHNLSVPQAKVIGNLGNLEAILRREVIDEIFVALSEKELADREEIFKTCEKVGVNTYLVPVHYEWRLAKSTTTSLGELNLIRFSTVPNNPFLLGIKRGIDISVSSLILIFFPFLYILIGLFIQLDSPGPVLYRQLRVAYNRRKFHCYKFRTMVKDADKKINVIDDIDETEGPIRKAKNDPRVTRVGRILRRFSIDEIPQFINVFKGEMSLVGPRPPTIDEVDRYEFHQLRRLSVKQGLTGLWQVSGRDAVKSFDKRLKLDLYYIDHWSLWLDIKIMFKTIYIVFKGAN
jgi:exopolysaccharide biosynthesis polyprenyl glycosylphosphotransferase